MVMELQLGDILKLKKVHPCGSYYWEVVRLGADIGIKCCKCERHILLPRSVLERKIKEITPKEKD
jgi:hypothetical protein